MLGRSVIRILALVPYYVDFLCVGGITGVINDGILLRVVVVLEHVGRWKLLRRGRRRRVMFVLALFILALLIGIHLRVVRLLIEQGLLFCGETTLAGGGLS